MPEINLVTLVTEGEDVRRLSHEETFYVSGVGQKQLFH